MFIRNNNLTIRNATSNDASILCKWWNDGKVMAHAGLLMDSVHQKKL